LAVQRLKGAAGSARAGEQAGGEHGHTQQGNACERPESAGCSQLFTHGVMVRIEVRENSTHQVSRDMS